MPQTEILGTNVKGNTKKYTLHFYLKNCEYNDINTFETSNSLLEADKDGET